MALGVGLPRVSDRIYGRVASKTTLAIHAIAETKDGRLLPIDAEQPDRFYAEVRIKPMTVISQPSSGEEALEITEQWIRLPRDIVVIDSVIDPEKEIEGDMGTNVGL